MCMYCMHSFFPCTDRLLSTYNLCVARYVTIWQESTCISTFSPYSYFYFIPNIVIVMVALLLPAKSPRQLSDKTLTEAKSKEH